MKKFAKVALAALMLAGRQPRWRRRRPMRASSSVSVSADRAITVVIMARPIAPLIPAIPTVAGMIPIAAAITRQIIMRPIMAAIMVRVSHSVSVAAAAGSAATAAASMAVAASMVAEASMAAAITAKPSMN